MPETNHEFRESMIDISYKENKNSLYLPRDDLEDRTSLFRIYLSQIIELQLYLHDVIDWGERNEDDLDPPLF